MKYPPSVLAGSVLLSAATIVVGGARPALAASNAVRTFGAGFYIPFEPVTVTVQVTPDSSMQVWAVEDTPPLGWSVANISHNGVSDAVTGKVKWGVFFDHNARALSYQATPPIGEEGNRIFAGAACFANAAADSMLTVTGASTLSRNTTTYYTLTTGVSGGHGTISPPSGSYLAGATVNLTATPDAGYRVRVWHGTEADASAETTNIVYMTRDKIVTVEFEPLPLPQYPLQTDVSPPGAGSVARQPNATQYTQGTSVVLTAMPAAAYVFDHWEGDLTGADNPATLVIDAQKSVMAVFILGHTLSVTISPVGAGTVARSPDQSAYRAGTQVTLTPAPNTGYVFDHWTGALTGTAAPATLTLNGDASVTAFFVTTDCNHNGVTDALDIANSTSFDCDGNGIPDECESDSDQDGVIDACDNCPAVANADQVDADANGVGDACQACPGSADCFMPADTDHSWTLDINEVTAYGAAWRTGTTWSVAPVTIPIEFATRAGYLWRKGGQYHFVAGQPPPACWQEGAAGP